MFGSVGDILVDTNRSVLATFFKDSLVNYIYMYLLTTMNGEHISYNSNSHSNIHK